MAAIRSVAMVRSILSVIMEWSFAGGITCCKSSDAIQNLFSLLFVVKDFCNFHQCSLLFSRFGPILFRNQILITWKSRVAHRRFRRIGHC